MAGIKILSKANSDQGTVTLSPTDVEENLGGVQGQRSTYYYPSPIVDNSCYPCSNSHSGTRILSIKKDKTD